MKLFHRFLILESILIKIVQYTYTLIELINVFVS
jgi:hypothetical protein